MPQPGQNHPWIRIDVRQPALSNLVFVVPQPALVPLHPAVAWSSNGTFSDSVLLVVSNSETAVLPEGCMGCPVPVQNRGLLNPTVQQVGGVQSSTHAQYRPVREQQTRDPLAHGRDPHLESGPPQLYVVPPQRFSLPKQPLHRR